MTPTKPLPGSERIPMPGAREIGPANPNEQVEVTIRLRPPAGKELAGKEPSAKKPPSNAESIQPIKDRTFLTRQEFARQHGADPAAIARVASFAHAHNLTVKEESPARRTVILTGTVAAMNAAFG
ncbi:MAG: protease pro-enzyme activation domain-containing protein, partial [Terriglobales bacterium]